jgi:deoxyribodipyrimidine photo-lyase
MESAVWWIRRDLRLSDNQALHAAVMSSGVVIPLFIIDPVLESSPNTGQKRLAFLYDGLRSLDADLQQRGSRLIVRKGNPLQVLKTLLAETDSRLIFAEGDISPYARQRDDLVRRELPLQLTPGVTVHPVKTLRKADDTPYTVFTPFSRMWQSLPLPTKLLPIPEYFTAPPPITSLEIPTLPENPDISQFPANETEALGRLGKFTEAVIYDYGKNRNRMDFDGTSGLSPYLRFGMVSARQAVLAAREAESLAMRADARHGAETWLNELIWREFYAAILYHFPYVQKTAFRPGLRNIPWRQDNDGFTAWAEGRTGYPAVDAGMRQLNATGWMHNRARMITASFLTKDLLIDWRLGEQYFMQRLIDGDPAANNGGWQWTAGTGTDAAPYFRVFNPILQGKKFDPNGTYVRRWLPELASVPDEYIHAPWEMPSGLQVKSGCVIGKNYPAPIVDHAKARQRVLEAYRSGVN